MHLVICVYESICVWVDALVYVRVRLSERSHLCTWLFHKHTSLLSQARKLTVICFLEESLAKVHDLCSSSEENINVRNHPVSNTSLWVATFFQLLPRHASPFCHPPGTLYEYVYVYVYVSVLTAKSKYRRNHEPIQLSQRYMKTEINCQNHSWNMLIFLNNTEYASHKLIYCFWCWLLAAPLL